jgi:transcriptional regulator with XRE-family HTH domain
MGMVAAGAYLRSYRKRLGLSQGDVAAALGMSQPKVVTEWESGKRKPLAHIWNLWVEMLGADPRTAHRLMIEGKSAEDGLQRAEEEFTEAVRRATREERDVLVARINGHLARLLAEGDSEPIEDR